MAVEYEISSDVATIKDVAPNTQVASIVKFYTGSVTYDDEPTSKYASVTINGKTQRVMLCVAVSGTVNYDDVPCLYSTVDGHRTLNVVEPTETGTPDDVPSLYETVVVDGKTVRALRCVLISATPNYDGISSTCTFTDNGKTHTAQLVNKIVGGSIEIIVKGVSPLSLPDAVANSLSYVKAFGGTEQNGTPTPTAPVPIMTNNGVLKASKNLFDDSLFDTDNGTTIVYRSFSIPNGIYTMSTNFTAVQSNGPKSNVFIFAGRVSSGANSSINGVYSTQPRTITVTDGYYTVAYRSAISNGSSDNPKNFDWMLEKGSTATPYEPYGTVIADGLTETIRDSAGHTATAQMLLSVGDYKDEQNITTGAITRRVGVKVLDGTENWGDGTIGYYRITNTTHKSSVLAVCSHLKGVSTGNIPAVESRDGTVWLGSDWIGLGFRNLFATVEQFKAWLAEQYAAGTPVVVVYPLATETTESVAGQELQVTQGDNVIAITQASIDGLELEAKYAAAVALTIQEVQDANLDPNVQVTII